MSSGAGASACRGANWEEWGEDAELRAEDYPTVEAVAEHWRRDEADMRAWLASLTDMDLDTPPVRDEDRQPLWHYVMHLYSPRPAAVQRRRRAPHSAWQSPGDIGFLEFVQATGRRRGP